MSESYQRQSGNKVGGNSVQHSDANKATQIVETLTYNFVVGDWVVMKNGSIIDAMSWHDLQATTREEAELWFKNRKTPA